jgi:hypothetical protein
MSLSKINSHLDFLAKMCFLWSEDCEVLNGGLGLLEPSYIPKLIRSKRPQLHLFLSNFQGKENAVLICFFWKKIPSRGTRLNIES